MQSSVEGRTEDKKKSEGLAQEEKSLRMEAEQKATKAANELKEATHQHWREKRFSGSSSLPQRAELLRRSRRRST